ncbi:MAG: 15-cis-phytoene desaturase [Hyphomicrobiaceae bacterium]|jgi:15-cis-phytoene desaturase
MSESVAIVGGGIGGLCAAHHLSWAGVQNITVYEAEAEVGGKARSQYPELLGGVPFPGEHGFRFFPHFYRHLLETLRQIDVPEGGSVWDRLIEPGEAGIAYNGRKLLEVTRPVKITDPVEFVSTAAQLLIRQEIGLEDGLQFLSRLLEFGTSCQERRDQVYDRMAWTKFTGAADGAYEEDFNNIVIKASQNLSAMRAAQSSAATIGAITWQLMFLFGEGERTDAILPGPTDEMWLRDWHTFLEKRGVKFRFGMPLQRFRFDRMAGRIEGLDFGAETIEADHYIAAVPLESMAALVDDEMATFDPCLGGLKGLASRALGDMVGVQFFLTRRTDITSGHVHYPGTPFALTSISQGQFWRHPPHEREGLSGVKDVVSVIISDPDTVGTEGLRVRDYTDRDALCREVWRQMSQALPDGTLYIGDVLAMHLDENVSLDPFVNRSRLLIHPVDQLGFRPDAETAIENLFLASDYVRTYTDLATMEGADEAARRAVRAILDRMEVDESRWPLVERLDEGDLFKMAKARDRELFRMGLPHAVQIDGGDAKVLLDKGAEAFGMISEGLGDFQEFVAQTIGLPTLLPGNREARESDLSDWLRLLTTGLWKT